MKYRFLFLLLALAAASCKEDLPSLSSELPNAAFTFTVNADTFPYKVVFTNQSSGSFNQQWDFGDQTPVVNQNNPTHYYDRGGTVLVRMIAAGSGGQTVVSREVVLPNPCDNPAFAILTGCNPTLSRTWRWSPNAGHILVLSPDFTQTYFSAAAGSMPACQSDDRFNFTTRGRYNYTTSGQAFLVQAGFSCQTYGDSSTAFRFVFPTTTSPNPRLVLTNPRAFIGTSDVIPSRTWEIVVANSNRIQLLGTLTDGARLFTTYEPDVPQTLEDIRTLLNGGGSRTWMIDNTVDAPIIVGTESNPAAYFGGVMAGTLPACQSDDEYTFTQANNLTYDGKGETFAAGVFTCNSPDRSFSDGFTFSAVPSGVSGLGLIKLPDDASPPTARNRFIGVTDAPSNNVYRIISINSTNMLLRAGDGSGTVWTMKFRVKP
jgi:hypothetical protein